MSTRDEFLLSFVRIFAHFTSVGVHVFLKNTLFGGQSKQKRVENEKLERHSFRMVPVPLENSK